MFQHRRRPVVTAPGFYHWLRDEAAIRDALAGVIEGLVFDVEHNELWRDSWGARPRNAGDRRARVTELVDGAPRLLPIFGHRYVLAEGPTLVLSVRQSDIIVYGADLREYLLHELEDLLDVAQPTAPANPAESVFWMRMTRRARPPSETPAAPADPAEIPFWGELIDGH